MRLFTEARERLRSLFFRERQDRELDEEVLSHLEMEIAANLQKGMHPDEARRRAAITFGAVERVKEEVRDARSLGIAEDLIRDLKYAIRRLGRTPALSVAVMATLAVGIGSTTAVFSLVNGILLAPLPYPEPDRLVRITNAVAGPEATGDLSDAVVLLYQNRARAFDGVAAWRFDDGDLGALTSDQPAARIRGARVTANFFDVLGVPSVLGRTFHPGEDRPGMNDVVVLSHRFWKARLQAAPDVIGRRIVVNNVPRTIVGVMPPGFAYPSADVELWLPLSLNPERTRPATLNLVGIGRLRRGTSEDMAREDLLRMLSDFEAESVPVAGTSDGIHLTPRVQSLRDSIVAPPSRLIWFVFAAAILVLIVTCTNVAGLLLVRTERAQVEIAARAALGAGFRGILTLMLTESLLLSVLGGTAGVLLAVGSMSVIRRAGSALSLPRIENVTVDSRILLFAAGIAMLSAVLVSLLPIVRARRVPIAQVLRGAGSGEAGTGGPHRARDTLVVVQIALAVVLVALSGLMARSLASLYEVHPGFESDGVVTSRVLLPYTGYGAGESRFNFFDALVRETRAVPGVRDVALTDRVPFAGSSHDAAIEVESRLGVTRAGGDQHALVHTDDALFETLRIPILSGRTFGVLNPAMPVDEAIVSRSFAERYWPDSDPIGKRIRQAGGRWFVVVGVAGDVRYDTLEEPPRETVYFPLVVINAQGTEATLPPALSIVVRTDAGTEETLSAIRRVVAGLDATLPTFNESSLRDIVHGASARTRALAALLVAASGVTLLLGAIGLYGLLSYVVSSRQREFSIRMALGARPADLSRMITLRGLRLAAVGIVFGLGCALATSQLLRGFLFGVGPTDTATLAGTCGALLVVAIFSSWIPARRAAAVDPAESL